MHVTKETVHELLKNTNKTSGIGRRCFLKKGRLKIREDMYKESWLFSFSLYIIMEKKMLDNAYGSFFLFLV